jgi:hypothetical protein
MLLAPLEGWRPVDVTDQRTAVDFARIQNELSNSPSDTKVEKGALIRERGQPGCGSSGSSQL